MKITSVPVGALLLSAVLALTGVGSAHVLAQPTAPNTKQSQQQAQALKGPLLPAGGIAHRDIAYVNNGHERQKLDLYLPENKTGEKLPVIIWVHGGSWSKGSKIGGIPLTRGFNARGYAIACVGYRLTDTAPFPAQIEDCKAAVRWLRANAVKYNLDTTRFAAWGSSAGGHLVAMLGTTGGIRTFDIGANPDVSSAVQAVIDYFGPTDFSDPVLKGADYVGAIRDSENFSAVFLRKNEHLPLPQAR